MAIDTWSEAANLRWAALAAMSGEDRLLEALELSELVVSLAEAGSQARAASGFETSEHSSSRQAFDDEPQR